jgi:hypothetical protein
MFWPVMTECPLQRTFSLWCHNVSVNRLKVCRMILYDSLMIHIAISLKKTDFHVILINRQKFQNETMPFKKSYILKTPLFGRTVIQGWFFFHFIICRVVLIQKNTGSSIWICITCFIELIAMSSGEDIRLLRVNLLFLFSTKNRCLTLK